MFPLGDPRPTDLNSTYIYTLPQGGYPYHKYEGWNSSAFFWADPDQLKDYVSHSCPNRISDSADLPPHGLVASWMA
jgi:hypothetical protein